MKNFLNKILTILVALTIISTNSFAGGGGGADSGQAANRNNSVGDRDRQGPGNVGGSTTTSNNTTNNNSVADRDRQGPGNVGGSTQTKNTMGGSDDDDDGYYNNNFTTSPSSGTYTNTSNNNTSNSNSNTFSGVVNALKTVAQSTINAAQNLYGAASPNVRAAVAGQKALEASITGTTNIDSLAAKRIMERAMYMGRIKHLVEVEGINVGVNSNYKGLTLGPFEEKLKQHSWQWDRLSEEEKKIAKVMDRAFANFGDFIALPGDITPANGPITYGPDYNKLEDTQKLALRDGYTFISSAKSNELVFDGKDVIDYIADLAGNHDGVSGLNIRSNWEFPLAIARGNLPDTNNVIVHELHHMGGEILYRYTYEEVGADMFPAMAESKKRDLAMLELGAYGYGQGNIKKFFPKADMTSEEVDYLNSITEQLSWSASVGHSRWYQELVLKAVKSAYSPHSPVPVNNDHLRIAEAILNSPTLKAIRDTQNEYAAQFLD